MSEVYETVPCSEGATLITIERLRQIKDEGHSFAHDDEHTNGELVKAATSYAALSFSPSWHPRGIPPLEWPWHHTDWKPGTRIEDLTKAGALIAAEIDRLKRLQNKG